jgi:hypothetical protein
LAIGERWKKIDLNACAKTPDGRMKVARDGNSFTSDSADRGYSSYEILNRAGDRYVLELAWSGGGTGVFQSLLVVRKSGATVTLIKHIAGGDRCNGGLSDIQIVGNKVRYASNLTPYDMAELGGPSKLKAYEDLSASAGSCVATEEREYDLATGQNARVSVTLTGGDRVSKSLLLEDQAGWTEKYKYDHCFNNFYNSYVRRKQLVLKAAAVGGFSEGFKAACVK